MITEGNCLELMKQLPTGSIDLILTDPPYSLPNNQFRPEARVKQRTWGDFSTYTAFFNLFLVEAKRVLKSDGDLVLFCDETFYPVLYPSLYAQFYATKMIVWDKERIGMGGVWRRQFELITHSYNQPKKEKSGDGDIIRSKPVPSGQRSHNSEKPVVLLSTIIQKLTDEGETVLDPFAGSGSTGEAAMLLGRKFIGFEIDPDHANNGQSRLSKFSVA